tara:strand:- start:896 stop:1936 length:1041 start_codon:yes stop_codon:yes gene_type:complete
MNTNHAKETNIFKNVIRNCLAPSKKERILIIGDYGTPESNLSKTITHHYATACKELGLTYEVIFQKIKIKGEKADEKVIQKLKELPEGSIIILTLSIFIGTLKSVGLSFRKFCYLNNHRFLSASGLSGIKDKDLPIFLKTIDIDYNKLQEKGDIIKKQLDQAKTVHITTPAGTNLTMDITDMTSINNAGAYTQPATGGNLPAGEVYIPPASTNVNGTIVIDGSSRTRQGTVLIQEQPTILEIKEGSVTNIKGGSEAKQLQETIEWAKKRAKYPQNVSRVCELGIGTNPNATLIGATIIDEKASSTCHIALGSNSWFGGGIYSIVHLDQVLKNPTIHLDGKKILIPQ